MTMLSFNDLLFVVCFLIMHCEYVPYGFSFCFSLPFPLIPLFLITSSIFGL